MNGAAGELVLEPIEVVSLHLAGRGSDEALQRYCDALASGALMISLDPRRALLRIGTGRRQWFPSGVGKPIEYRSPRRDPGHECR